MKKKKGYLQSGLLAEGEGLALATRAVLPIVRNQTPALRHASAET